MISSLGANAHIDQNFFERLAFRLGGLKSLIKLLLREAALFNENVGKFSIDKVEQGEWSPRKERQLNWRTCDTLISHRCTHMRHSFE